MPFEQVGKKLELHKYQADLHVGLKQQSLVADCPTRWSTTGKMIARILEQEEPIRRALSIDRKVTHLLPKWQELKLYTKLFPHSHLSHICCLVKITSQYLLFVQSYTKRKILKENDTDTDLTKYIKEKIHSDLTTHYQSYDSSVLHLLNMASVLDTRFKMKYIDSSFYDNLKESLLSEGEEIAPVNVTGAMETGSSDTEPPPSKKSNIGSLFKDGEDEQLPILSPSQRIKAELETYLSSKNLDMEQEPLLWWKQHCLEYPILSLLARKYLCNKFII